MLDFAAVTSQIKAFSADRERSLPTTQAALDEAQRRLMRSAPEWEAVAERIVYGTTAWTAAEWIEPPDAVFDAPPRPMPHAVLAADGSQIVSDRHDVALCYLLNVGIVALSYGTGERPVLTSRPALHLPDDDLLTVAEGDQSVLAPRRLAIRRQLAEFAALTEFMPQSVPTIALYDYPLIFFLLDGETEEFRAASLAAFQTALDAARHARIPAVGYTSQPQNRDVINALRVAVCPHEQVHCKRHCPNQHSPRPRYVRPPCAYDARITDAEFFATFLLPGQRSALFASRAPITQQYYRPVHAVHFFYLHTGREIARVEIPAWVANDSDLLSLTHALCWDQCVKGDGYPVALAEAHEQAIVRGPERQAFFHLMERFMVESGQTVAATQKSVSKRARRV